MAAGDAKTTKECDEVGCCTSGGMIVAVANHVTAVVATTGEENKERNTEVWVKCQE